MDDTPDAISSKAVENIITPETEQHGTYEAGFVMHVETQTTAYTKRHKGFSSLVRMHENGQIDDGQFIAAQTIVIVAEKAGNDVGVRGASLEARVDNSGGNRDLIIEHIQSVRDEIAYNKWRRTLPMPRRLILDMLLVNRPLAATARKYKMGWPRARKLFVQSLDRFIDIRERVAEQVDEQDLDAAHKRLALDFGE